MSVPHVVAVAPGSPADRVGIEVGDKLRSLNGRSPRDVIEYQQVIDTDQLTIDLDRAGLERQVVIDRQPGEALGVEVHSALFDQVRTCDNHCEFCFIYQLPPGLRESLYLKDDDYRLSFLYGNFTTLTRFTEADLERVVTERLSPINVSIHATNPDVRNEMLRNRRGGPSLRWLRALLDHGIEVHGQVVVCPGLNDADVLDETMAGVLDCYPELKSLCVVPLGVSRFNREDRMRPHTAEEVTEVIDIVERWQEAFLRAVGRRVAFLADEYYLLAGVEFPALETYEGIGMAEDGVGMARAFEAELLGRTDIAVGPRPGFFAWVDGAPADGYRAPRQGPVEVPVVLSGPSGGVVIVTGTYGAQALDPMLESGGWEARILPVENRYFGGNIGVTGLLVGEDLARTLADQPERDRYLLPDVCLSEGRFLDGSTPADLPRPVEIIATEGVSLRRALEGAR